MSTRMTLDGRFDAALLERALVRLGAPEEVMDLAAANAQRWLRLDNALASFLTDVKSDGVGYDEMTRRQRTRDLARQHKHRGKTAVNQ